MAAEPGIEPGLRAPKTPVLPLHNSASYSILKLLNAEGRDRTDTGVAPQQFLRLSRLPIPPLRLSPISDKIKWSGRRDSNSRPPPWQGGVLPLNYFRSNTPYGAEAQIRTGDTRIFNPLLYQLSYLGVQRDASTILAFRRRSVKVARGGTVPRPGEVTGPSRTHH
jgi:hypothetical protein